jgi:hypothetical protein
MTQTDNPDVCEEWLEEAGRAFDAMQRDPSRAIPMKTVFDGLRARHAARCAEER